MGIFLPIDGGLALETAYQVDTGGRENETGRFGRTGQVFPATKERAPVN
jgi:hypothetical protein